MGQEGDMTGLLIIGDALVTYVVLRRLSVLG